MIPTNRPRSAGRPARKRSRESRIAGRSALIQAHRTMTFEPDSVWIGKPSPDRDLAFAAGDCSPRRNHAK